MAAPRCPLYPSIVFSHLQIQFRFLKLILKLHRKQYSKVDRDLDLMTILLFYFTRGDISIKYLERFQIDAKYFEFCASRQDYYKFVLGRN